MYTTVFIVNKKKRKIKKPPSHPSPNDRFECTTSRLLIDLHKLYSNYYCVHTFRDDRVQCLIVCGKMEQENDQKRLVISFVRISVCIINIYILWCTKNILSKGEFVTLYYFTPQRLSILLHTQTVRKIRYFNRTRTYCIHV